MQDDAGTVSLYVRKTQEYDVLSCVHNARKGIRYQGNLPKIPEKVKAAHYKLIRFAHDSCGPDGDALSAFQTPSLPKSLVLRLVPAPGSVAYNRRMSRLPHLIMTVLDPEEERLMRIFRRRGCAVSHAQLKPKPKPVWWRAPEEEILVPIAIPDVEDLREAIADLIGEYNTQHNLQEKSEELAPYMLGTVVPIAAAVTIQAAWLEGSMIAMDDTLLNTGWLETSMTVRGSAAASTGSPVKSSAAEGHRQLRLPFNQSQNGLLDNSLLNTSMHGSGGGGGGGGGGWGASGLLDTSLAAAGYTTDGTIDCSLLETSLISSQNKPSSFRLARVTSSSNATSVAPDSSVDDHRSSSSSARPRPPSSTTTSHDHAHQHHPHHLRPPLHTPAASKTPPLRGVPEMHEGVIPNAESLRQVLPVLTCV